MYVREGVDGGLQKVYESNIRLYRCEIKLETVIA